MHPSSIDECLPNVGLITTESSGEEPVVDGLIPARGVIEIQLPEEYAEDNINARFYGWSEAESASLLPYWNRDSQNCSTSADESIEQTLPAAGTSRRNSAYVVRCG
jgi:hypothetical protein